MKNKKIFYLLTIIITFFSINVLEVKAATPLTCLYSNNEEDLTILLTQSKDGDLVILENPKKNAQITDKGWTRESRAIDITNIQPASSSAAASQQGGLVSCPGSISITSSGYKAYSSESTGNFPRTHEFKENYNIDEATNVTDEVENTLENYEDYTEYENEELIEGKKCSELYADEKWLQSSNEWNTTKYQMACLYQYNYSNGCHIIQLNVGKTERRFIESYRYSISVDDQTFSVSDIKDSYEGSCPEYIMAAKSESTIYIDEKKGTSLLAWKKYSLVNRTGNNIITDDPISIGNNLVIVEKPVIESCEDLFGEKIFNALKTCIKLVKILIPIALIGFGIVDLGLSIFAGDEDKMKKAQKKFIKRIIISVVIFLIPSVLQLLLTIAKSIWPNIDATLCGLI